MQEQPIQDVISNQSATPVVSDSATLTPKGRHFLIVFFFSFMWGIFGVDRFYLGKIWTGILKLLTAGGLGIWVVVDLAQIMSGSMRDKQGNEMLEVAKYKKFAARTILIFVVVMGLLTLVTGAALFYVIYNVVTQYVQGGNVQIPGFDQLQNFQL